MIIGLVNGKGGVGKTTSAIYLGAVFTDLGHEVVVIDMDAQGSASDWADRAEDAGAPLPFPVEISNAKRLGRMIKTLSKRTIVIIDTPPGDPLAIDTAIDVSDFVIIPTRPYGIEVSRVWETLPSVEGVPHAVLITSARLRTKTLDAFLSVLEAEEVPRFTTLIPLRESIPDTWGEVPAVYEGYENVAAEILEAVK